VTPHYREDDAIPRVSVTQEVGMRVLSVFAIVAVCLGACKKPDGSAPEPDAGLCKEPRPPICEFGSCGVNSPVVNSFPVNGLRPDAECNPEGVQLLPGSLKGGKNDKCKDERPDGRVYGATLDVRENELVGMRRDGTIACAGDDLEGASFTVRSWVPVKEGSRERRTLSVTVAKKQSYRMKQNGAVRTAYRMTTAAGSLCASQAASEARKALGLGLVEGLVDPDASQDLVIPISSELYDWSGAPMTSVFWRRQDSRWLQLACVGDALAKRSLLDLFTDDAVNSRAALTMLVANYCGNLNATVRGQVIGIRLLDDAIEQVPPGTGPLEAKWTAGKAVCVSAMRLFRDPEQRVTADGVPTEINWTCPECQKGADWVAKLRGCPSKNDPKPKPLPTCETCAEKECQGRLFHSYLETAP
jgi:hypothetical protein